MNQRIRSLETESRRPSLSSWGEGSMDSRRLTEATGPLRRGYSDSTMARMRQATGETLLAPSRNRRSREPYSAVKLVDDLTGESPVSASYPVGTVVISGGGAGDQSVESPEVNALVGWMEIRSAPTGGLAMQQVVAQANRSEASKIMPSLESECEDCRERRNRLTELKANVSGEVLGIRSRRVPRGLGGRHVAKEHQ